MSSNKILTDDACEILHKWKQQKDMNQFKVIKTKYCYTSSFSSIRLVSNAEKPDGLIPGS